MKNRSYAVVIAALVALMAASGASAKSAARTSASKAAASHSYKVANGAAARYGADRRIHRRWGRAHQ
jgi:hypothetical protein